MVAKGVLDDFILDAVRLDEPSFRLKDKELMVIAGAVKALLQFHLEAGDGL